MGGRSLLYADVYVDISIGNLDRTYQYRVPDNLQDRVYVGSCVTVNFGRGTRQISGYIVSLSEKPACPPDKIKDISDINDTAIPIEGRMIMLAAWIKENFGATMNDALKAVMPVKKSVKRREYRSIQPAADRDGLLCELEECRRKKYRARERLIAELLEKGELDYDIVVEKLMVSAGTIKALEKKGTIKINARTIYRNPQLSGVQKEIFELNEQQNTAANEIKQDIRDGVRRDYLLFGITGSGKTEVYMSVIDEVVKQGRQVIMLIPEIALTYQTVMRFYARFGERISILNSRMSAGERYDQSMRAKNGEIDIMIGPRSALFTPFSNLGLIIIDEEHEASYKNEGLPRYSTREVAVKRGELEGASVLMGSATPSVEAYSNALLGKYRLLVLEERAGKGALPEVHIVDMREELKNRNRSMFSEKLRGLIADRLEKHQQTMLFLNRRGYSGFISCRSCGYVIKCPHCDVSLTVHRGGRLVCHYCGHEQETAKVCPKCGSPYIGSFGIGTQKVEEMIKKDFPSARVLRMDADTTKGKTGHEEILSAFKNGEADILIGTQMIVKGHDFHGVTLVGILAADMSLNAPDYRSAERTFQLLTQASGRAGRGELVGEVVIQTYNPGSYSIVTASQCDYREFFRQEMSFRRMMEYPPSSNMLLILCCSRNERRAQECAAYTAGLLEKFGQEEKIWDGCRLIGPAEAQLAKANDIYRRVIYIKAKEYEKLVRLKNRIAEIVPEDKQFSGCTVQFDFNPVNAY